MPAPKNMPMRRARKGHVTTVADEVDGRWAVCNKQSPIAASVGLAGVPSARNNEWSAVTSTRPCDVTTRIIGLATRCRMMRSTGVHPASLHTSSPVVSACSLEPAARNTAPASAASCSMAVTRTRPLP